MTLHSLYPAFIKLKYHTDYSPHIATIPTRAWIPSGGTHGEGGFEAWDLTDRDAHAMILELATAFSLLQGGDGVMDSYTIYTMASEDAFPLPVAANALAFPAGDATPGWDKWVQATWTFYDTAFETAKLVLLDAASQNNFNTRPPGGLTPDEQGVADVYMDEANAWSSRNNLRPSALRSCAFDINDALKRQYS
jgi:hypothetical protein